MLDIKKIRQELEEMDLVMTVGGVGSNNVHVNEDKDFNTNAEAMAYGNEHVNEINMKYGAKQTYFFVKNIAMNLFRTSFYIVK